MVRILCLVGLLCGLAGCLKDWPTNSVGSNPFSTGTTKPAVQKVNFAPAPAEVSTRVDNLGRKILAANPEIGVQPLFATIGSPAPEVFHQGTALVYITAGLVGQCKSDAELAAVLSQELGKMVSEREAGADPRSRNPDRLPPLDVPIGQAGNYGSGADMTHMAEMAKFENRNPPRRRLPPPNPQALAVMYLEKAGYQRADLDAARPLLQSAEKNIAFEQQLTGGVKQAGWTPQ